MNTGMNGLGALLPGNSGAQPSRQPADAAARQANPQGPAPTEAAGKAAGASAAEGFDVNGLVGDLWGFMQGRLAQAKADGASEAEMDKLWKAAESGLEKGFGEARGILESMGKLDDALSSKVDTAYGKLTEALEARDLDAGIAPNQPDATADSEARRTDIYQYQERRFALDVTTAEGDRVRISVDNRSEAGASDGSGPEGSFLEWARKDSGAFDLNIEGDLNDRERADLKELLGQVNNLADEFYDGDLGVAFDQAQALGIEGTSLASMDLNMRSVESRGVAAYQQADEGRSLPRGLEPLRDYAREMIDAQQQWQQRLDSDRGLPEALENHPRNDGRLGEFVESLLGG